MQCAYPIYFEEFMGFFSDSFLAMYLRKCFAVICIPNFGKKTSAVLLQLKRNHLSVKTKSRSKFMVRPSAFGRPL